MQSFTRRIVTLAKIGAQVALGLGILGYLLWVNRADLTRLLDQPKRWSCLAVAFAFCATAIVTTFLRWFVLVWAQGLPFRLQDSLRIGFIGYMFNQIIPGAVSGDLVKAVLLAREQQRRTVAISTVAIDRIVGLYAMSLVAALAATLFWTDIQSNAQLRTLATWVCGVAGVGTVGMIVLFTPLLYRDTWMRRFERLPLVGGVVRELLCTMRVYLDRRAVVVVAVAMSLVVHTCLILSLYFTASAFGPWPLRVHAVVAPMGLAVNAIPLTPGGIGLGEGAMQKLFELAGQHGATALGMMLSYRVINWLLALGGVPYLIMSLGETRRAMAEAQATHQAAVEQAAASTGL
jgi:uncharacterized protein (TIRG00374 family)